MALYLFFTDLVQRMQHKSCCRKSIKFFLLMKGVVLAKIIIGATRKLAFVLVSSGYLCWLVKRSGETNCVFSTCFLVEATTIPLILRNTESLAILPIMEQYEPRVGISTSKCKFRHDVSLLFYSKMKQQAHNQINKVQLWKTQISFLKDAGNSDFKKYLWKAEEQKRHRLIVTPICGMWAEGTVRTTYCTPVWISTVPFFLFLAWRNRF